MYPVLFHIGSFPVHSWGVLLMIGFVLALWRCFRNGGRCPPRPSSMSPSPDSSAA